MIEYNAPDDFWTNEKDMPHVFLGGSIEMGKAEKWQDWLTKELTNHDVVILNPRRDDWDSSWKQDPTEGTQFYEQVDWEMYAQEVADFRVYYFAGGTMSPITLLELGSYGDERDTIVYVDPEYERRGNVIMYCNRYAIPWVETKSDLRWAIESWILKL